MKPEVILGILRGSILVDTFTTNLRHKPQILTFLPDATEMFCPLCVIVVTMNNYDYD